MKLKIKYIENNLKNKVVFYCKNKTLMIKYNCIHKVGDSMDKTIRFDMDEISSGYVLSILKDVKDILEEKGYNSTNQIVGYLISGDPGYITSYKDARRKITQLDRSNALEVLIKAALK